MHEYIPQPKQNWFDKNFEYAISFKRIVCFPYINLTSKHIKLENRTNDQLDFLGEENNKLKSF